MGGRRVIPTEAPTPVIRTEAPTPVIPSGAPAPARGVKRSRGIPPRLESSPGDAHVVRSGGLLSMTWVAAVSFRAGSEVEPRNPPQAGVKSRRCSRRPQRRTPQHDMGGRRVIPGVAKWSRGIPPRLESSPGDAHVVRSGGLLSMTWVAAVSFRAKRLLPVIPDGSAYPCHSERSAYRCHSERSEVEPRNPPRLESSPGDAHVVRSGGLLSMTWVAAVSFRTKRLRLLSGPKRLPLSATATPCHSERSEAEPRNPPQAGVKSRRCSRRPQRRTPQHDMGGRRVIPTEAPTPVIPSEAPTLSFRAERLPLSFRAKRSGAEESPPGWSQVQEMLTSSAAADSSA